MSLRTLLTTLLLTCSFSVMAATEIVPLNYRTSADMLPMAQDFIGKDGQVSAYGNQLIVNADQRKIDELKALIAQLDTAAQAPADHRRHQRKQLPGRSGLLGKRRQTEPDPHHQSQHRQP